MYWPDAYLRVSLDKCVDGPDPALDMVWGWVVGGGRGGAIGRRVSPLPLHFKLVVIQGLSPHPLYCNWGDKSVIISFWLSTTNCFWSFDTEIFSKSTLY